MKILVTKSQSNNLNSILNENQALSNFLRNGWKSIKKYFAFDPVGKILTKLLSTNTRTGNSWESIFSQLITNNQFNTRIRVGNLVGTITKPKHLAILFYRNMLTNEDAALIIKTIINNAVDDKTITEVAKFMVARDKQLRQTLKGLSEIEIKRHLRSNGYNSDASDAIAKEFSSKFNLNFLGREYQRWVSNPKLYQLIFGKGPIDGQSKQKILIKWLLTGTTRKNLRSEIKLVVSEAIRSGLSLDAAKPIIKMFASFTIEAVLRWLSLVIALTFLKYAIQYWREQGTEEMDLRKDSSSLKLIWDDFWGSPESVPFRWVIPIRTIYPMILDIIDGILRRETPTMIYDKLISNQLPEQKELEQIENEMVQVLETESELDQEIENEYSLQSETESQTTNTSTTTTTDALDSSKFPLKIGSKGEYVIKLQKFLNDVIPQSPLVVTGVFDQKTKDKLDQFKNLTNEKFQ
jgi:hypothetical protein